LSGCLRVFRVSENGVRGDVSQDLMGLDMLDSCNACAIHWGTSPLTLLVPYRAVASQPFCDQRKEEISTPSRL
jgi:hypothetical protein